MSDIMLTLEDFELLHAVVSRRDAALVGAVARVNAGEITEQEQRAFIDALGDELWEDGMDSDGLTEYGDRLRCLIDAVQIVGYYAKKSRPAPAAVPGTDD